MVRTARKLPKEWAKYEAVGNVVQGTRLFAFKTPLAFDLVKKFSKTKRFTIPDLYRDLVFRNMELGMVINATNTTRYYDSAEISNLGYGYHKLPLSGRSFVECEDLVKSFIRAVDAFLENNRDNTVETARGYTIERGALIQAVHRADREKRLRKKRANYESEEEDEVNDRDRRKKRRRPAKVEQAIVDDTQEQLDPQVMQEIMQFEQSLHSNSQQISANESTLSVSQQQFLEQNARQQPQGVLQQQYHAFMHNHSETSSPYVDSPTVEDEEVEEEGERIVDFSLMGKVDVVSVSTAARRRERRKKLESKYDTMKRGKFWEINEMRKTQ